MPFCIFSLHAHCFPIPETLAMSGLILLEDDPVLRLELCEFLDDCGFATDTAANLHEFHQRFAPQRHSIAVLDLYSLTIHPQSGGCWQANKRVTTKPFPADNRFKQIGIRLVG